MTQYAQLPTYGQPLHVKELPAKVWYRFFSDLHTGQPPAAEYAVTPKASPFSFVAPVKGSLIVTGGTVSLIRFSRNGTTFYATGQISGMFALNAGDTLAVTYSVAPTLTFVPQ
jgi:hypothetical protein